jgi:hypothetical protein|tara:strand:- start:195 stop:839 length:645 start_codon:yes stop_codon:yes gene_type:complete
MKFNEITENASSGSTGAGNIATVVAPMGGTQSRNPSIYGGKKAGNLLTGKKSKGKYANSVEARKQTKVNEANVTEDEVLEQEVLVHRGAKKKDRKTGFVKHGESRVDHEVKMAKSDLFATAQNAQEIMSYLKDRSEEEGIKGWMQSYITLANDYLNSVKESLQYEVQMHEDQPAAYGNGEDDRINTGNKLDKEPYGGPSSSYPGGVLQSTVGGS